MLIQNYNSHQVRVGSMSWFRMEGGTGGCIIRHTFTKSPHQVENGEGAAQELCHLVVKSCHVYCEKRAKALNFPSCPVITICSKAFSHLSQLIVG